MNNERPVKGLAQIVMHHDTQLVYESRKRCLDFNKIYDDHYHAGDFFIPSALVVKDSDLDKIGSMSITYVDVYSILPNPLEIPLDYKHQIIIPFWLIAAVSRRGRYFGYLDGRYDPNVKTNTETTADHYSIFTLPQELFTDRTFGLPIAAQTCKMLFTVDAGADGQFLYYTKNCTISETLRKSINGATNLTPNHPAPFIHMRSFFQLRASPKPTNHPNNNSKPIDHYYIYPPQRHDQFHIMTGFFIRMNRPFTDSLVWQYYGINMLSISNPADVLIQMELLYTSAPNIGHQLALDRALSKRLPSDVIELIWNHLCKLPAEYVYWVPLSTGVSWKELTKSGHDFYKTDDVYLSTGISADICFSFSAKYLAPTDCFTPRYTRGC